MLKERLSVSFRSQNVSKLEMVTGKDAELGPVLVVVTALLLTLLVVPTCKILSPHFGPKNTILEVYSQTFHRRGLENYWPRPWAGNIFLC